MSSSRKRVVSVWTLSGQFWAMLKALLARFDRVLRPVMALAALVGGFSLVLLFGQLQRGPLDADVVWGYAQTGLQAAGAGPYLEKFKKLAALTTRNARYTVLRDNMERTRLMLEAYKVEGGNVYPQSIAYLHAQATSRGYWNLYHNPLSGEKASYQRLIADYRDYQINYDHSTFAGMVLYEAIGNPASEYRLYACDDKGELVNGAGGTFTLGTGDD
ncbi:MAG: hypothetical protein ACO1RX_21775 [Candidatus Sericytochromatia bacterium]